MKKFLFLLLSFLVYTSIGAQTPATLNTLRYTVQVTQRPTGENPVAQPPCLLTNQNNGYQCTYITGATHNRIPIVASTYFLWDDTTVVGEDIVWRRYYQQVVFSTGRSYRYFTRVTQAPSRYIQVNGVGDDCFHYILMCVDSAHLMLVCYSKLGDELWKADVSAGHSTNGMYNLTYVNDAIQVVFHTNVLEPYDFYTAAVYVDVHPKKGVVQRVKVMKLVEEPSLRVR